MKKFTLLLAFLAFIAFNVSGQESVNFTPALDGSGNINLCAGGSYIVSIDNSTSGHTYNLVQAGVKAVIQTLPGNGGTITFNPVYPGSGTISYSVGDASDFSPWINFKTVVIPDPTAPTLIMSTSSPVCEGTNVSATLNQSGSGGVNCSDRYEYSTDGGSTWSAYTLGTNISTTGYSSVQIKAIRDNSSCNACNCYAENVYSWTVTTAPVPTFASGSGSVCELSSTNYTTQSGQAGYQWSASGGSITAGGGLNDNYATITWNAAGQGQVSVSYSNPTTGCSAINPAVFPVTINALPTISLTGPQSVCVGKDVQFTTDPGMSNYVWNTDGTIVSGGTSSDNTITVSWATSGTGNVSVNYDNANGCQAQSPAGAIITVDPAPVVQADVTDPDGNITTMSSGNNYTMTICSGEPVTTGDATSTSLDPAACGPLWVEVDIVSTLPNIPSSTQNTPVGPDSGSITITPENHTGSNKTLTFTSTPYYDADGSGTLNTGDVSGAPVVFVLTVEPTPVVQADVTDPDGNVTTMSSGNNYAMTICSGEAVTTGDATSSSADPGSCGDLWVEVTSTTDISTLPPTSTQNAAVAWASPPTTITPENHDGVAKDITFVSTPYYDVDDSHTLTAGDVTGEPVTFVLTVQPTPVVQADVTDPDGNVTTMSSGNNYAMTICSGEAVTTGDATSSSADPGSCGDLWVEVTSTTDISTLPPTSTQNAAVAWATPPTTITPENHDGVAKDITFVSTPYYDVDDSHTLTTGDITGETVTFVLTVNPELVPTLTGPTSVCANSTQTYTTDTGMSNYSWSITGGSGSSTSNTIDVTWDNTPGGNHSVTVSYKDGNGCTETTTLDVTVEGLVQNVTTGTYYCMIQDAIDAATAGDEIKLLADITEDIVTIDRSLTLDGDGHTLTSTSSTYGIHVPGVTNVTIKNITVDNPETYGFQVSPGSHYLTLTNVTAQNCGTQFNGSPFASGFGINCSDHLTLTDIYSYNNEGNGLVLDGCNDVTITNVTTSGNSFGTFGAGIEISGSGAWCTPGSSTGVNIQGNIDISENPEIYETGNVSNVTLPTSYTHFVGNLLPQGKSYFHSLNDALTAVAALFNSNPGVQPVTYVEEIASGDLYVASATQTGINMSIQAASTAATDGVTINVYAGHFEEQVEVKHKAVTITGAGDDQTFIESPVNMDVSFHTSYDAYSIVTAIDTADMTIKNLTVDGLGRGNANYKMMGIAYRNSGGEVNGCKIVNIENTPFSGAQHGIAVYAYNSDDITRSLKVLNNYIDHFQKNAMAINSTPALLTVNISGNTVVGHGATDITAQNGIQTYLNVTGNITNNNISKIAYDNTNSATKWAACSMLLMYNPDIEINGNTISEAHVGIYNYNTPASIHDNNLAIEKIGVYAYGILATDPPKAVPSPYESNINPPDNGKSGKGTMTVTVADNTIMFSGPVNTNTYGIDAEAGWYTENMSFSASGNDVSGFDVGASIFMCETGCDVGVFTDVTFTNNKFHGNSYGMYSNVNYLAVNAIHNWWGDASGPYNDPYNTCGTGDTIAGDITFNPWWVDEGMTTENGVLPVYNVTQDEYFCTIQDAVDDATAGDVIEVAAGTYTENVTIDKSLELRGAKYNNDPRGDAWTSGISTIDAGGGNYGIYITAANVTVNGFKVINAEGSNVNLYGGIGVVGASELGGIKISYNWLDQNSANGIFVSNVNAPVVEYNYCSNNGDGSDYVAGISFYTSGTQTITDGSVSYNECYNNQSYGIYIASADNVASSIAGLTVSNNKIHNSTKYGLQLLSHNFQDAVTNLTVSGNEIYNNQRNGLKMVSVSSCNINMNAIYSNGAGGTSDKYKYGVMMESYTGKTATGNSFTKNSIHNNTLGGVILRNTGGSYTGNVFNNNSFVETGTNLGINNLSTDNIDAACNWWGTEDAYAVEAKTSGDVQFLPYLIVDNTNGTSYWWDNTNSYSCDGVGPVVNITQSLSYMTIQAAIDEASTTNKDIILISNGTYVENLAIDRALRLQGESMAGVIIYPAISAPMPGSSGSLPAGSSNMILIQSDNVTIDHLTLNGDNPSLTSGTVVNGVDIDARNGIIQDYTAGSFTDMFIDHVSVSNIYLRGIYATTGGDFDISFNTVTNVAGEAASIPIMNWAGSGLISHNTVSNSNDGIVSNHSSGVIYEYNTVTNCGMGIHSDNNGDSGGFADTIRYNSVSNSPTGWGIMVFASRVSSTVYENTINGVSVGLCAAGQFNNATPSFERNSVDNCDYGVYTTTSLFGWGSSDCNATFTNNNIDNCTVIGFECEAETGYTNNTTANDNHIAGNTAGAETSGDGIFNVDMTCNWWGASNSSVTGDITFIPYLTDGTDNEPATPGFQPVPGSCGATAYYVNDNDLTGDGYTTAVGNDSNFGTSDAPFLTIQHAVEIVPDGSTIMVDAGTYIEQIQVGKSLSLIGLDTTSTIIKSPDAASLTSVTWNTAHPVVYAYGNSNTVDISKIKIDGDGGRTVNWFIGALYYEANGTFDGNRITGIHDAGTFTGNQMGHAFYSSQAGGLTQSLTVSNNIIDDYQKGGIYIRMNGTTADVTGNTVIGQNVAEVTAQNGICFLLGSTGTIENNTVINNIWNKVEHPHTWEASGILIYQATATVGNNTLEGNEMGLATYQANGSTYNANTFNNNKVHVWLDAAGDVNPANVYDKYVLNPNMQEIVFGCIQYAVDEASEGDILNASAGTFVEQVTIFPDRNNLTLNGVGVSSTTIQSPAVLPVSFNSGTKDNYPVVFVDGVDNVVLSNLTVDGDGQGNNNYRFMGIGFWNAGGVINNVDVVNIQNTPFSGVQHGYGVYAFNNTYPGSSYTITIDGMNISNFQKDGLFLVGPGLTVDVDNVTVTGAGATSITGQNGFDILDGVSGTISNCNIKDIDYTGSGWVVCGVLMRNCPDITIENSTMDNCQLSAAFEEGSGGVFKMNKITNPTSHGVRIYNYGSKGSNGFLKKELPSNGAEEDSYYNSGKATVSVSFDQDTIIGPGSSVTDQYGIATFSANPVNLTVSHSVITNWYMGILAYNYGATVNTTANNNDLSANAAGFYTNETVVQDVKDNWWGDQTGPYNDPHNTCGLGSEVYSENDGMADFYEWWADEAMTTRYTYPNPTFTSCPSDVTLNMDQDRDPYATGYALADEASNCYLPVTVTYSDDRSGQNQCNTTGPVIRTFTATDYFGHTSTCIQTITIEDNISPLVVAPADITQDNDPQYCSAAVTYDTTATDFVFFQGFENTGWVPGHYYSASLGFGPSSDWNRYNSPMARVASGTDGITSKTGNAHAVFSSAGIPDPPDDYTGVFSRLGGYSTVFGDGFIVTQDVYFDVNDPAVTAGTYGWDLSCAVTRQDGNHLRDFIFHAAGYSNGVIAIGADNNSWFTRRDVHANYSNYYDVTTTGWYTLQWVFRDNGAGILAVDCNLLDATGNKLWTETRTNPLDVIATEVGGNRYLWFTFLEADKLAIDNTSMIRMLDVTFDPVSGSVFNVGTTQVNVSAADACGNSSSDSFDVTVNDTENPVAVCQDVEIFLDANGDASVTAAQVDNGSSDNCGIQDMTLSEYDFTCNDLGDNTVTLTVNDIHGNSDQCQTTITVTDNIDPTVTCPGDQTECADETVNDTYTVSGTGFDYTDAQDNCTVSSVDYTLSGATTGTGSGSLDGVAFNVGITTVTWTATDQSGNTGQCTFDVTVNPAPDPQITGNLSVIGGTTEVYTTPYVAGHTYSWTVTGADSYVVNPSPNDYYCEVVWGPSGTGTVSVTETIAATGCDYTDQVSVTITPVALQGTITYKNSSGTPMSNVTVRVKSGATVVATTTTDASGHYNFNTLTNGSYTLEVETAKDWGGANSTDALAIQRTALNYTFPWWSPAAFIDNVGDVNASNTLSSLDALLVKQRAVYIVNSFSAGDWAFWDVDGAVNFTNTSDNVATLAYTHSAATTLNIQTMCYGDVNGSFTPGSGKSSMMFAIESDNEINVQENKDFVLPVKLISDSEIGAMSIYINYPDNIIDIKELKTTIPGLLYTIGDGWINVAWSEVEPLNIPSDGTLFTLVCSTDQKVNNYMNLFMRSEKTEFADENCKVLDNVHLNIDKVNVLKSDADLSKLYSLNCYPNPLKQSTNIKYVLPENGQVQIVVSTSLGNVVAKIVDGTEDAGDYLINFRPSDYGLGTGVYYVRMIVQGETSNYTDVVRIVYMK